MKTPSVGIDQNKEGKFIDRYFGRIPKFIHRIPEQNICEANPDYLTLIGLFIDGNLNQKNVSEELYREVVAFVDKMCNPCIMEGEDMALLNAYEGRDACPEQECEFPCDALICCNELLSCKCDTMCVTPKSI